MKHIIHSFIPSIRAPHDFKYFLVSSNQGSTCQELGIVHTSHKEPLNSFLLLDDGLPCLVQSLDGIRLAEYHFHSPIIVYHLERDGLGEAGRHAQIDGNILKDSVFECCKGARI